jgi:transposase
MALKDVIREWKGKEVRDLLQDLYINKDMTMKEVASELHISVGIVHKWLASYSIHKEENIFKKL